MNLKELSLQYALSSAKCRERLKLLSARLDDELLPQTDMLILKRSCTLLEAMARETAAISRYLSSYYGKGKSDDSGKL